MLKTCLRIIFYRNSNSDSATKLPSSLLGLVQNYNSDSESDQQSDNEAKEAFEEPPEYLQTIIEKAALYVAKNGAEFEEILRIKQDPRFTFLDLENEYHPYYMHKVKLSRIEIGTEASVKVHKKSEIVKKAQEVTKSKVLCKFLSCYCILLIDNQPILLYSSTCFLLNQSKRRK